MCLMIAVIYKRNVPNAVKSIQLQCTSEKNPSDALNSTAFQLKWKHCNYNI